MEDRKEASGAGTGPPPRWRILMFIAASGLYYAVYYTLFVRRVSEYFGDILKHFEFVRRLFP